MGKVRKISKEKGVQMCADLIYSGKVRKDIVQQFTKEYGLSESAVDKWIKVARVIVETRQQAAEAIRVKVEAEEIEKVAKELGIDRRAVLAEYKKVAFMDVRRLYNEDGTIKKFSELDDETAGAIAGVEVFEEYVQGEHMGTNRKVKTNPKLGALDSICKLLGFMPQSNLKLKTEDEGGVKTVSITLNLG